MSYEKQNFANGDVLTAAQLNHIENGIADVESAANATKGIVDKIIDPTLTLSGKAADARATGAAVSKLDGSVKQLREDTAYLNDYISFEKAEDGYVNIYSNLVTDNARKHIDVVLQKGDQIRTVLSGKTTNCCIFAYKYPDGTYSALVNSKGSDVEKYEYTSTFDEKITITISFDSTEPHNAIITRNNAQRRVFKCSAGTSFTKALQNLSLIGDDVEKILYVEQGIYDIYKEIGGAAFANTITDYNKWYEYSVFVPKNTKIIGIGNVILTMDIDVSELNPDSQATNALSPLNIREACSINNIQIAASRCRYGLHIEGLGQDKYNNNLFELNNVSIKFIGDTYGFGSAIGIGLNKGCVLSADSCIFKTDKGWGIGGHLNNGTAIINISNSAFDSKKQSFSISNNITAKNANCVFSFYNCYMPKTHVGNSEDTTFNAISYNFIKTDTTITKDANTGTVVHNDYGCTVVEDF